MLPPLDCNWSWEAWEEAHRKAEPWRKPYPESQVQVVVQRAAAAGIDDLTVANLLAIPLHVIRSMSSHVAHPDPVRDEINAFYLDLRRDMMCGEPADPQVFKAAHPRFVHLFLETFKLLRDMALLPEPERAAEMQRHERHQREAAVARRLMEAGVTVPDRAAEDAANKQLGDDGEAFVVADEVRRLRIAGCPGLATQVAWTARDLGDGFGYDVTSFNTDGTLRLIEVKTTNGDANTDYFVTARELQVSKARPDDYWLYRVFDFSKPTRAIRRVQGALGTGAHHLRPTMYRATLRQGLRAAMLPGKRRRPK